MESGWAAVIVTGVIQVATVVYVAGRWSAKFETVEKWIADEAKPSLREHGEKIAILETKVR